MGKTTLARQRGQGRVEKVEATPAASVDRAEQEKLMARQAEMEAEVTRLRNEAAAANVPREAMGR